MLNIYSVRNILYLAFIFFIFFPYVSFFDTGTDLQPWGMLIAGMLFLTFRIYFTKVDLVFGVIMAISILLIFIGDLNYTAIRSVSGYVSLFLISYTSFRVLRTQRLDVNKIIKISAITWVAVGFVQITVDKSFLSFLLPAFRTTDSRGVVGLAPEPSFYGIVLLFFILYLSHSNASNRTNYIALCSAGIIFLSQSSMVVLMLLMFLLLLAIIYLRFKYIISMLLIVTFVPALVSAIEVDTRIFSLISMVASDPIQLLAVDASVNDRFYHILFSVKGAFDGYLLPHGYSSWIAYAEKQIDIYSNIVIVEWFSLGGRIMSGYGSAFFELGIFAIMIPIVLTRLYWDLYRYDLKKFYFYAIAVNVVMMTAIPIGFTLFAFYIAFLRFLVWQGQSNRFQLHQPSRVVDRNYQQPPVTLDLCTTEPAY